MKNPFKQSLNDHAYNEDRLFSAIMTQAESEGLTSYPKRRIHPMRQFAKLSLSLGLAVVLSAFALSAFGVIQLFPSNPVVAAVYALDINPSFELSVNPQDKVIEIVAVNADAETITFDDLIGLPAEEAVEALIERAEEAGFIDLEDLEDDFVVITTIAQKDQYREQSEGLHARLRERIEENTLLQAMNVVTIKATLAQLMEARGDDVPVGLYVLHGMVTSPDGTILSAKEFFSKQGNLEAIEDQAQIQRMTQEKLRQRIELALNQLENTGVDTTELRTRLENGGELDMLQIQAEVRNQLNPQGPGNDNPGNPDNGGDSKPGNGNG
jgi:hypothetical protein